MFRFFFLSVIFCFNSGHSQESSKLRAIDSLIALSIDGDTSNEQSLNYALKSQNIAQSLDIDSITLKVGRNLSLMYLYNDQIKKYIPQNYSNLRLAYELQDSSAVSVASFNLGSYYRFNQQNDSAFYFFSNSIKHLPQKEVSYYKAQSYFMVADVEHVAKVYEGAEEDAVRALNVLDQLPENEENLDMYWGIYNLLAIISKDLGNYKMAIDYYEQSIAYAKQMQNGYINEIYSINNKANAYRKLGQFEIALNLYVDLISQRKRYEDIDPSFYGNLINNIALTKIESGNYRFGDVEQQLKEAIAIAYKEEDDNGKLRTTLDLSSLYLQEKELDSVKKYATLALEMADSFSSNEAKQKALFLLAAVIEGNDGKELLIEHIRLGDSLEKVEKSVRNRIARIKYGTDQLEAENEQISKENLYLVILSIGLLLTAILVYLFISQRAKNRKLKLIQFQQKANEDIYNLMLGQQDKVDEARAKEKIRVSKELHDGVLGRLFGTRLSLDSMNFKDGKEAMMMRANYIAQLKTIEQDIRKISHELNTDFVAGSSFMAILTELIETQSQAYVLKHEFDYTNYISWDLVSNKAKINIYRIIQESMQNIYKHANAKLIKISISLEKNVICLIIIDNGEGFDTSKSKRGIGLKNMISRVEDIDGKITFTSQSGDGTIVNVKIPYTNQFA
jgi:signal transduction histidine kinase